jgi:CheY-like chemotaxis protein
MHHSTQGRTPCRILVAEDHAMLLDSFAFYLRYRGYEVYTAPNGALALEIMEQCSREGRPVHMLITDIDMPVLNGEELIAMVRAADEKFPILAMTNSLEPDEVRRLARYGRIEFIDKPFRLAALQMQIERLLPIGEASGLGHEKAAAQVRTKTQTQRNPNEKN